MDLKPVKSTNIKAVGYDQDTSELQVEFQGGGLYAYDSVPLDVYRDLTEAHSVGGYFHKNIKDVYKMRKLKSKEHTKC